MQKYQESYRENYNEENEVMLKKKRANKYLEQKAKISKDVIEKKLKEKEPYDPIKRRET